MRFGHTTVKIQAPADQGASEAVSTLFDALGETQARELVRTILQDKRFGAFGVPSDFDFIRGDLTLLIRPNDVPWRKVRLIQPIEGGWEVEYDEGVPLAFQRYILPCKRSTSSPFGWLVEAPKECFIG